MDKVPLLESGRQIGTLAAEASGLYTLFTAEGMLPDRELWCAWVVGDRGELRLGVLEPRGPRGIIRRKLSRRETDPLGRLLRGELRPAGEPAWRPLTQQEAERLKDPAGALVREKEGHWELALPFDPKKPFPLTKLFCLGAIRQVGEKRCVVFWFDRERQPCLPPEKNRRN